MALKDLVGKVSRPEAASAAPQTTDPKPPPVRTPTPPPAERYAAPVALLDASVEFTGTIRCHESIRIDGRCQGELFSDHAVIIGQPAVLQMTIEADSVVVAGEVNGNITALRKITLEPTARVRGNLCTPGIVIQEGARLEGRIVIDADAQPQDASPEPKPAQAAQPAAPNAPAPAKPAAAGESVAAPRSNPLPPPPPTR
jgi:cytoskeletal protein CcmA (bactofilin family)